MLVAPIIAPLCPLCGQANECAVAAMGSLEADCWCRSLSFTEDLLSQVPPDLKNKACICRPCAERAHAHRPGEGQA